MATTDSSSLAFATGVVGVAPTGATVATATMMTRSIQRLAATQNGTDQNDPDHPPRRP
jgi:hypothetical protein